MNGEGAALDGATGAPDATGAPAGEPAGVAAAVAATTGEPEAAGVKTLVVATAVVVVKGPLVTVTVWLAEAV